MPGEDTTMKTSNLITYLYEIEGWNSLLHALPPEVTVNGALSGDPVMNQGRITVCERVEDTSDLPSKTDIKAPAAQTSS